MSLPEVEVIVPTEARLGRAALLRGALRSILEQEGVQARPIVVVNGDGVDPGLRAELEADPRLRVRVVAEAHLPGALRIGREMVRSPWFAALDDDDLLLPGALAARLGVLCARPEVDVVVSNGYRQDPSGNVLQVPDAALVQRDPLRAMLTSNWLLPGSWLCRSDQVGPELFDAMPKYLECTYLGLRFASGYRMFFLELPTVIWRTATPDSMSKSRSFALGQAPALRRLLELELPGEIRADLKRHLTGALHAEAELRLREGARRDAWRQHLRSLCGRGGWRYLGFTTALLRGRAGR
jgi:glycosyltransferase involved in cell wall biosynthesis